MASSGRPLACRSRGEKGAKTVQLTGKKKVARLAHGGHEQGQQGLMREVMKDMLAPFRKKDAVSH